ncbi:Helix-turn-helix [Klebsiella pneumoniae]|uniref:Helix-turn-helix n=2 Tax=Klebsiella pneumoniae TaxID=573 RepID=A0A378BH26_KLEPO|nr:helix-turn-helix domain-containing protein [Klebsiella pneumoniae]MBU9719608.1 helix-turn-helix domain-containing protein [Klebsiella pneumoniae subsp. ozaenae]AYJ94757.1 helix-turn-helix transcriptional regulator [Klebsiella pneumoniae]RLO16942.1 helix-turn-helix transcriptional regulator [Klebsiella pneumoniae]SQC20978.1 Helix-turn-helix [Klebsiella pneumoniae]STR97383.1 Helix-turn-helix [Klebsiella pneumoniae]
MMKLENNLSTNSNEVEMSIRGIHERIYHIRTEVIDCSRDVLAKSLKVGRSTIQNYENGTREPSASFLVSLSSLAGVHIEWLMTGKGAKLTRDQSVTEGYIEKNDVYELIGQLRILPEADMQLVESRKLAFRKDWLEKKRLDAKSLCISEIKDESMAPLLSTGDIVLLSTFHYREDIVIDGRTKTTFRTGLDPHDDKSYEVIKDGLYLVRAGAHSQVRRVQLDPLGGIFITADNPVYQTIHIEKEKFSPSIIEAKVEWLAKSLC